MRTFIGTAILLLSLGSALADEGAACKFSDPARLKEHLQKHVTYPSTGKAIKATCAKEWPEEFTATERACCSKKIKDAVEYKSATDVEKALGI
jgi:hypothetical protein